MSDVPDPNKSSSAERRPTSAPFGDASSEPASDEVLHCLLCGGPMVGHHCHLQCVNCGYTEDCTDLFRAD